MELSGSFDAPHLSVDGDSLSSSPSPIPSLSSTPSVESPESINSVDFQTMAKIRFLATKWKRRSLSGSCRTSRDLKLVCDTLDMKDEGEGDPSKDDVAIEAEAIKLEIAAAREDNQQDLNTSTSSTSSCVSANSADDAGISRRRTDSNKGAKESEILDRKRGSLLRRAKKALGISNDTNDPPPRDHAAAIFNQCGPDEAIEKLKSTGDLKADAASVAEFFHTNQTLNKFKIGKYVGTLNDFNIKVLHELVGRLDFSQLDFDIALRHLLYLFRLPAEAQQINRIMDAFGTRYFDTCTNSVFVNADAAQIMAFSCIMLTTDAHNPRVAEKMTKQQFVTLTRGMNGDGNFPKDFLEYMFEKVVDEPLIRIDHTTTLFPYATKRGWVHITRRKSWKRYYGLLFDGSLYLQRKPMETKWRRRITNIKLVTPESLKIPNSPTPHGVAISGVGDGAEAQFLFVESHRDLQGWVNVMS